MSTTAEGVRPGSGGGGSVVLMDLKLGKDEVVAVVAGANKVTANDRTKADKLRTQRSPRITSFLAITSDPNK